jgi:hypothetical protein
VRSTEHGGTYLSVTLKGEETTEYAVEIAHLEQLEAAFTEWIEAYPHDRRDKVLHLELVSGVTLHLPISAVFNFCENSPESREAQWRRNDAIGKRRKELFPDWDE